MKWSITWGISAAGAIVLALPLLLYSKAQWQRPPRTNLETALFKGITYQRKISETPWPYIVHVVTIDLMAPGIEVQVSPGLQADQALADGEMADDLAENFEAIAYKTSEFLLAHELQLAVNASYFYRFREKTPWDFYPHSGNRVNVLGEAIADGKRYSSPQPQWPALCFAANNQAQIASDGTCPAGTVQAIAGNQVLMSRGELMPVTKNDLPYSRVAVAIDAMGERLWLIVVDGKQRHYSHGITLSQLAQIATDLGADAALICDNHYKILEHVLILIENKHVSIIAKNKHVLLGKTKRARGKKG
ncbi:MAG: phosphodiester glycosidase family protein, partial [Leptolyngbya sp. SIO1D8]|nr:phosphodiester glycosidase family protein [Leptolyngbya sp. SIO1D8]